MTTEEITTSFEKYTSSEISKALEIYFEQREDKIFHGIGRGPDGADAAHVKIDGKYFIIINDAFFDYNYPALYYTNLIHEASHAAGTWDYYYYHIPDNG